MDDKIVRIQLCNFLKGQAHMPFAQAVKNFSVKNINTKPPHVEYSFWHLLEHIRRTQADILEFVKSSNYKEKKWPSDYWPDKSSIATKKDWDKTISLIQKDLQATIKLVGDKKINLYEKIPWGDGQTYLREFLLIIKHNSYHIGEFAILRQVLDIW